MTAQTGSGQTVAAEKSFDAFGNLVSSSGTWYGQFSYGGPFGYQSDGDYGLQLLGHRYYDPSTGRFLTRDPIKDGRNWYRYAEGSPMNFVDPTGYGVYQWIYTGNWNAGEDEYTAAIEAATEQLLGRDEIDPEGYPVRIGGPVNWVNPSGMAITPDGVTHINQEDEETYWNSARWRHHEHRHVHQRLEIADMMGVKASSWSMFDTLEIARTRTFLFAIIIEYIEAGSHDGSGLEQDADRWAENQVLWGN